MKKLLLLVALTGCTIIGPDERGVSITLGKAGAEALNPGPYFWLPFVRGIKAISILVQKTEMDSQAGTKDLQQVKTHAALNWHINPQDVVKIYTTIGRERYIEENIIVPAFNEVTKQATAKKTAEEVLSKREDLKTEIDETLREHLKKYGILVDDVNIINVVFTDDFEKAVEAKQVAEQRSKQAVYEAIQAKVVAGAEISKAQGEAKAQALLRETIDDKVLRRMAIEKWDGKFPQFMGGKMLPFINMPTGGGE